ncbi:LuxR C-terminal-related transcriptional regulator [Streptomyces sp. NBC_00988]|uniref:LuxR C-terminal-related transcriptional regulator n=1 Tax=Streptomyces sp. NBC_00988 TaxID=2903704 RepID=UPI0038690151|nr:LuxR C-terminal-related transcriptional regulator [Streptomyces sp. NBC_00988]
MGRGPELDAFAAALTDGECRGFVVGGPAGVGKSRLGEECLGRAAGKGLRVGRAAASAAAGAVPLGAIAHLLPAGVDLSDPVAGFAAVARGLAAEPGRQWVLFVDDMHLLDASSAVLLRQLMDTGALLLIGTVRTGEPYGDAVAALRGGDSVYRVDLTVLSPQQVDALLQAALGRPVARRTLHELSAASGGNVLYLRELVLGALATGNLTEDGEIWHLVDERLPGTARLTEMISTRLAAADPAGRPVLELLALCEPLSLTYAEALAPPQVIAALEQAGLIRVAQDRRRTTVSLAHPLYGEVLRAGLPLLRRRALLLDQAARVQARGARRRGDLLHIATWQLAATGTADPTLLAQAAVLARHAHDLPQTVALLKALPEEHRTTATDLRLGEALFELGRWQQAEATLAEANALAVDDQDKLAVALVRTTSLLWSNAPVAEALAVNDAARAQLSSPADRRKLTINEGFLRVVGGRPSEGLALLEDLETDVGDAPDLNAWLRGAWMKPAALALVGRTAEATTWARRAHDAHRRVQEHALAAHPAFQRIPLVLALTEAGAPAAEICRVGEPAYAELTAAGSRVRIWLAVLLGRAHWLAGHPVTARRWWAEAATVSRGIDHAMALRPVLGGLAACAAVLGDLDAAEATLTEHRALPPVEPGLLSAGEEFLGEAWLLAARGHLRRACSVLVGAAATARGTGHVTGEALLLTDVARLGGAEQVTGRLTALARSCDGELAPARVQLVTALAVDDPERLLRAADACQAVGADLLAAEASTAAAAAAWRRVGRPRRASAAAHRAATAGARCEGARTPLLAVAQVTAVLTTREREIALLAAGGNTSQDIARSLTLSVRTVDNHLQHAYTKLGVTTRRELAQTFGTSSPGARPHRPL